MTSDPCMYQEIAPKALHLRELGLSDGVIAKHLGVSDSPMGKADDSEIEFHGAYDLAPNHIAQVESVLQRRVLPYFRRMPCR